MIRKFALACAVLAAVATPVFAEGIKEDADAIQGLMAERRKVRSKAAFEAWRTKGRKMIADYLATHGAKTEVDDKHHHSRVYFIKILVEIADAKQAKEALTKAKSLNAEVLAAKADHEEATKFKGQINTIEKQLTRYFAQQEARAKAEKARDDALMNKPAPTLEATEVLDGEKITLEGLKGKVVILDFWATWCGPCRRVIPHLVELKKKHAAEGLEILGVTRFYGYGWSKASGNKRGLDQDAERQINRDCSKDLGMNYPILFTNTAAKKYFVRGIPQLVVVDRNGKVRYIKVGAGDHSELDKIIAKCLAEKKEG